MMAEQSYSCTSEEKPRLASAESCIDIASAAQVEFKNRLRDDNTEIAKRMVCGLVTVFPM